MTDITFASTKAKFLKITQTGSVKGLFWSIGEIEFFAPTATAK
jgi:glucose uptake protein GlcU